MTTEIIQTIDYNLRENIELFWNRKTKKQGYNIALVESILTENDNDTMSDISFQLDLANKQELKDRGEDIPSLRLNRLDFLKTESGDIVLIEQNPGWVDNIGMAAILSEDFTILERIKGVVEATGSKQLKLLYSEAATPGRYEQELTAQLFTEIGLPSSSGSILDAEVCEDDAIILSAPVGKMTMEEFVRIEQLRKTANLVSPTLPETDLEDNSLLNKYGVGIPSIPANSVESLKSLFSLGFSVVKSPISESGGGIAFLAGEETEAELEGILAEISDETGLVLVQEQLKPLRVSNGIGLDFIGEQGNRPKGNPLIPLEVDLTGRAVKFTAWTVNGKVTSVIGTVARNMSTYVNDAGFNFNARIK